MKTKKSSMLLVIALFFSFTMIHAQDAAETDLVGARGSSAETALNKRGYEHIKTSKAGSVIYSYWWNGKRKQCICNRVTDGKVASIVNVPPFDCGKKNVSSSNVHNGIENDLVGARGSSAETALNNRGYNHIKTSKAGSVIYSYWWNKNKRQCICERVADGKVVSIVKTSDYDCDMNNEGTAENKFYHHRSYHHANDRHYADKSEDAAFEIGFNAGKDGKEYKNVYSDGDMRYAYEEGYTVGSENKGNYGGNYEGNYKGGYVDLKDLIGRDENKAYAEMKNNRGFKEVHSFTHNGNHRKIMHNAITGQCVEVILDKGRVKDIKHYDDCAKHMK